MLLAAAAWDPKGSTGYRYNDEAGMPYAYHFSRAYTFIHDRLGEEEADQLVVLIDELTVVADPADSEEAQVIFADIQSWQRLDLLEAPTILLANATEISEAVKAMSAGNG